MGQTQVGRDTELTPSLRPPRPPRRPRTPESTLPSAVEPPLTPRTPPGVPGRRPRPRPRPSTPSVPGGGSSGGGSSATSSSEGGRVGLFRRLGARALRAGARAVRNRRERRAARGR